MKQRPRITASCLLVLVFAASAEARDIDTRVIDRTISLRGKWLVVEYDRNRKYEIISFMSGKFAIQEISFPNQQICTHANDCLRTSTLQLVSCDTFDRDCTKAVGQPFRFGPILFRVHRGERQGNQPAKVIYIIKMVHGWSCGRRQMRSVHRNCCSAPQSLPRRQRVFIIYMKRN